MSQHPVPMSLESLAEILAWLAEQVRDGDSLEGHFEWLLPDDGDDMPAGTDVVARGGFRVGNRMGQGGFRMLGPIVLDSPGSSRNAGERRARRLADGLPWCPTCAAVADQPCLATGREPRIDGPQWTDPHPARIARASEPRFVFRAQDAFAVHGIETYRDALEAAGLTAQAHETTKAIDEFRDWQITYPRQLKTPDHTHVPAPPEATRSRPEDGPPWTDAGQCRACGLLLWQVGDALLTQGTLTTGCIDGQLHDPRPVTP
jgi:hypothetical protein